MTSVGKFRMGLAVTLGGVLGLTACGAGEDDRGPSALVIDRSVSEASPEILELDGLTVTMYYDATSLLAPAGTNRPLVMWEMKITDDASSKSFRADVELRRNGNLLDAYYYLPGESFAKNEWINTVTAGPGTSSSLIPNKSGPKRVGNSEYFTSATGRDFEFTLTNIEVSDSPFTASSTAGPPAPTFDTSPAGEFNQLALRNRWQVPKSFEASATSPDYEPDPVLRPAAAMLSFIRQVNEREFGASPTQIFSQWMTDWDPQMLATGIEMLGDDRIKETFRRVQAGDIERWFGSGGTIIVGTGPNQIPPGTYRATAAPGKLITDGYWERTSRSGDIIDNNFVSSAQEVTVTIEATDGQFKSSNMGTWKPVG
jgi:hypothetical protein